MKLLLYLPARDKLAKTESRSPQRAPPTLAGRHVSARGSRELMSTAGFSMCQRTHSQKAGCRRHYKRNISTEKPALQLRQVIGPIVQQLSCGVVKLGGIEQLHELPDKLLPGVIAQRELERSDDWCVCDLRADAVVKAPNLKH